MNQQNIATSEAWLQPCYKAQNQNIRHLKKVLQLNQKTQEQLKQLRNNIKQRLQAIDEYIVTYKLLTDHPPSNSLISYIKFQRNIPPSYNKQMMINQNFRREQRISAKKKNQQLLFQKLNNNQPEDKSQQFFFENQQQSQLQFDRKVSSKSKKGQQKNEIQVYRKWCDQNVKRKTESKFNSQEDNIILEKRNIYRNSWQKIGQFINHRLVDQLYYQYSNRLNPNILHGRWTLTHTINLIVLVEHFGCKKWAKISQKIKVKNQLQVRQRFCNLIDPNIGKDIWSFEMQKKLLQIAEDYDFCWKKISKIPFFNNKTDNCVWRKWKLLMMRFTKEQINLMLPNELKYRGLADKIIRDKQIFEKKKRAPGSKIQTPIYFGRFKDKETTARLMLQFGSSLQNFQPKEQFKRKRSNSRPAESILSLNAQHQQASSNDKKMINQQQQIVKAQQNFIYLHNVSDDFLGECQQDQPDYIIYDTKK